MTTAPLLHFDDKDFKEIQQIVTFTEEVNLAKQVVESIVDLALMTKIKQLEKAIIDSKPTKSVSIVGKKTTMLRTVTPPHQIKESQKKHQRKVNELAGIEIKPKLLDQVPTSMTLMLSHIQLVKLL